MGPSSLSLPLLLLLLYYHCYHRHFRFGPTGDYRLWATERQSLFFGPHNNPLLPPDKLRGSMDFGNPFITQAERTDIVIKLYPPSLFPENSRFDLFALHRKRYLASMLEDQSPTNLLSNAPRITEMATRFEESVWRATSSKEEYVRMIQARIQVVQQQRRPKGTAPAYEE